MDWFDVFQKIAVLQDYSLKRKWSHKMQTFHRSLRFFSFADSRTVWEGREKSLFLFTISTHSQTVRQLFVAFNLRRLPSIINHGARNCQVLGQWELSTSRN